MGSEGQAGCGTCCDVYIKLKPYILMVALQFGSAGMYIISLASLKNGLSRYVLIVYRNAVAAIFLAPFAFFFERSKSLSLILLRVQENKAENDNNNIHEDYGAWFSRVLFFFPPHSSLASLNACVVLGFLEPILDQNLTYLGMQYTSASFASAIMNALPALTFIIAVLLRDPKVKGQSATVKSYPAELSLASFICFAGAAQSAAVGIVMERHPHAWSIGLDSRLLAPLYTGIVSSGLTYYIQGLVLKTRGPVFVTAFNPLCMIIVAILGSIILAEQIHLGSIIGGIIIAFGLYSVVWGKGKDQITDTEIASGGRCEDHELPITNTNGSKLVAIDDKMGNQQITK
ncbi:EamA domain [Dillenia turbinata]|uniref:WAT1-related protein n=1 Tax=Dillenia turbinata TaxID=194707 RepID=A0AAN8VZ44_9MAGN